MWNKLKIAIVACVLWQLKRLIHYKMCDTYVSPEGERVVVFADSDAGVEYGLKAWVAGRIRDVD